MTTFDDFATTAQNIFDNACKATGEFVSVSKLKIDRMNLNAELERQYAKLGKLSYAMTKKGETESPAASDVVQKIDTLIAQIDELTTRINSMPQ